MTTVLTPHSANQSANRCRSPVKVPKLRTGLDVQSALTAAMCIVAPTSIAAALGCTVTNRECFSTGLLLPFILTLLVRAYFGCVESGDSCQIMNVGI